MHLSMPGSAGGYDAGAALLRRHYAASGSCAAPARPRGGVRLRRLLDGRRPARVTRHLRSYNNAIAVLDMAWVNVTI